MDFNLLLDLFFPPSPLYLRNSTLTHPYPPRQISQSTSPSLPISLKRGEDKVPPNSYPFPSRPYALYRAHRRLPKSLRRV